MAERVKSYDSAHNRDELTQGIHLLEQRLARSTLFQVPSRTSTVDGGSKLARLPSSCHHARAARPPPWLQDTNPHIAVVPSTCQPGEEGRWAGLRR